VFTLSRSRDGSYFLPKLIKVSGVSEGTWEREKPVWHGDCDRERGPPKKKMKTKPVDAEVQVVDDNGDEGSGVEEGQGIEEGQRE
jgi:hypothetical protein